MLTLLCHTFSNISRPPKVRHTSRTPQFLVVHACIHIVLYLYIYIALRAVHTNQKGFQCERPREKRAVLRVRKEALGSPANKVDGVEGRSWFQSEGSMIAMAAYIHMTRSFL